MMGGIRSCGNHDRGRYTGIGLPADRNRQSRPRRNGCNRWLTQRPRRSPGSRRGVCGAYHAASAIDGGAAITGPNAKPELAELAARYRRVAPLYDVLDLPFEWARYRALRPILCGGLAGAVFEAGVGTGRNLAHYPPGVDVTGMDLSPAMLARAERRRLPPGVTVALRRGDVTATGWPDDHFDAVVASFVLLVLPAGQRAAALAEFGRVCRPGGEIRLLEYQRSRRRWRRALQAAWDPWARRVFGADFDLDLDGEIDRSGLTRIDSRWLVDDIIRLVVLQA